MLGLLAFSSADEANTREDLTKADGRRKGPGAFFPIRYTITAYTLFISGVGKNGGTPGIPRASRLENTPHRSLIRS